MENTLEEALRSVFSKNAGAAPPTEGTEAAPETPVTESELADLSTVISGVLDSYDSFKSSAAGNDWKAMGEELDRLDQEMERLRQQQNQ